ncbi:SDR family oxidoreductase [Georgenia halophila]
MSTATKRALVTGASTGIGAATVRRLRREGWDVIATARRADRLAALAEETGCTTVTADLTDETDVADLAEHIRSTGPLHALVNNAGGALGTDPVEQGDIAEWRRMYEINVISTLRLTQALLPLLRADGGGDVLVLTSTAAHESYPGGGGYTAAKHAERMIPDTLRLELVGEPVRILEVAPGMVKTEEFSLKRLHGDADAAAKVYAGVAEPLVADDVADVIAFALTRPAHVNLDRIIMRPRAQASSTVVHREG